MVTLDAIRTEYATAISELIEQYGSATDIPRDEQFIASERLRAGYCILTNPSTNIAEVFRQYSVDMRVWGVYLQEVPESLVERKQKRTDKYQSIIDWTQEHLFEQVTPNTVMEVGGISYPTALKFIGDRPDIFRKIKRGVYELRDPIADRGK